MPFYKCEHSESIAFEDFVFDVVGACDAESHGNGNNNEDKISIRFIDANISKFCNTTLLLNEKELSYVSYKSIVVCKIY